MPLYEKIPQRHYPGCWRWSSHWRCATQLVDELADMVSALIDDLEELRDGYTDWGNYHQDIDDADKLVTQVRAKGDLPRSWHVATVSFSFGKQR